MKKIILIFLIFCILLVAAKDHIVKTAFSTVATKIIGAKVSVSKLSFGILRPQIKIKDLRLNQPKGFPEGVLLDIPAIEVVYDIWALLKKKLYFPMVNVDLKQAVIIIKEDGSLNVDTLKVAHKKNDVKPKDKKIKPPAIQIDILKLNLGRVVTKTYQTDMPETVKTFEINVKNKTYKNIRGVAQLAGLILVEALKPTAIKNAAIYGAVSLSSIAFLPAGAAVVLSGKDSISETFPVSFETAYAKSLETRYRKGSLKSENKEKGVIKATVNGADVALKIVKNSEQEVKITVSARSFFIPKYQIAGTILHELTETLRQ
ncbi:MAG: hypothetical protein JSW17_00335 [Candidatus Omnitrophota bacterium]|nr:MAG: hypothetical protein JSW17_00335 [Candidatus Omnitrophota bacterium]